jgi:hypothetical protein
MPGCPSSLRVRRRTLASCALRKRSPNSASAADAATRLRMVQVIVSIAPLTLIGLPLTGKLPRTKYTLAWLREQGAERYEASKLNFYVGIVHNILRETKTWCAKIYLPTQRTNRQTLYDIN